MHAILYSFNRKSLHHVIILWECTMHASACMHLQSYTLIIQPNEYSKGTLPKGACRYLSILSHDDTVSFNLISLLHPWLQETPVPTGSHGVVSFMMNSILPLSNFVTREIKNLHSWVCHCYLGPNRCGSLWLLRVVIINFFPVAHFMTHSK